MSALPVSEKEGERRGKNGIGPRVKNRHANLMRKNAFTKKGNEGEKKASALG